MADEIDEKQIDLQREFNRLLVERQAMLNSQNQTMGTQANIAQALNKILGEMSGNAEDGATNSNNLADALSRAQQAASSSSDSSTNLADALRSATTEAGKLKETQKGFWTKFKEGVEDADSLSDILGEVDKITFGDMVSGLGAAAKQGNILAAALAGISLGDLSATFSNTFKQIGSVISGAFGAVQNIGMGVFGALSGAMGLLAEAGHQAGGGGLEIANAWEDVKKTISTVGPEFEAVKTAVSNLGMEGASLGAMFGSGPGGMASAIAYAGEVAGELGNTLTKITEDFGKNIDSYVIANKALGLSGAAMSNMQLMATHSGQELSDMLDTTARATVHLSQTFGVNAKAIGSNLDEMASDYSTFGGMSAESMASTAAYAAKLGIAMKDLQGITAKTDDFEGAAQAASELAGTFGMTIDTMDLMSADPAEKAEMIRESFAETGQSFEDMSRQEKARMADLTGMSEEALAGAFDPELAELGLDDFNSAADAAAAGAISQEEANLILAKSIDKVYESLGGGGADQIGGPFSAFFEGVVKGITNSEEFIALAQNFYQVMVLAHEAGEKVGQLFVDLFPGVKDLFEGLTEFFDPEKWKAVMGEVVGAFEDFFKDLSTDPEKAVQTLMDKILAIFDNFFKGNSGAIEKMKSGATKMINAIGGIITGMIPWLTEKLVGMIRSLAETLSGSGADLDRNSIGGALMGAFGDAFSALIDALPTIAWELFKALGQVLWAHKGKVAAALTLLAGWMALQFTIQLGKAILFEYLKAKILNKLTGKMKDDLPGPDEAPGPSKSVMESIGESIKAIGKISLADVGKAIVIAAMIVIFVAVSMYGMGVAIAATAAVLSGTSWEDMGKAIIALGVAVGAVWVLSKIAKSLQPAAMLQGGLGLLAGALFLAVSGAAFAGAIWLIDKILGKIDFLRVIELFAIVGIAIGAVFLMAIAGVALIADGGITLLMGGLGLIAGALFLAVSGFAFGLAIQSVFETFKGINFIRAAEIFATLGIAILATAALAVSGAVLTLAIPILIAAVPGLEAGATLMEVGAGIYAKALTKVVNTFSKIPGGMKKVEQALDVLSSSMGIIAGMAVLGAAFRLFMPLVGMLTKGLEAAGKFAETGFTQVGLVLKAIQGIPTADPAKTKAAVDITGVIVAAMADIAGLGIKMAGVAAVGSLFGDTSMDDMINMSVRFIEAVGDTLAKLIRLLVSAAGNMDEKAIKGAEAIGAMLGAVSSLISALSGPIDKVIEGQGAMDKVLDWLTDSDSAGDQIASVVEGMTDLLDAVGDVIPDLVRSMKAGLADMPEGEGFLNKAKAFGIVLGAISEVLGMWDEYDDKMTAHDVEKNRGDFEGQMKFKATRFATDITRITEIMEWEGWTLAAAALNTQGSLKIPSGAGRNFVGAVKELSTTAVGTAFYLNAIWNSGIMGWDQAWTAVVVGRVAEVVDAYNEQAASLASISPINIDAVLETVNESLRVRRDKITIADGNVTINMSLN
ncbi:MAG TPA: hypothetical protein EYF95_07295, partial [Flavobacteriales bacterium]|nr:hypothetical protein [Flavobacteriales bacterium]